MITEIQGLTKIQLISKAAKAPKGMQNIFRIICIILFLILIFCVPGFLKFRHYCQVKNYYVFAA
jgi:hypothetical protein